MKFLLNQASRYASSWNKGQLLVLLAFASLSALAIFGGLRWKSEVLEEQTRPFQEVAESRSAWFESLKESEAGIDISPALAHPMNLPVHVHKPPGPLGQFSHQREDMYASAGIINGFSNEALMFRRYELESPLALMHGGFDLVLVVLVVMPLGLCLLNYNHLASEREQGRLPTLLIQGARPAKLLRSRSLKCSYPLLVLVLLASFWGTVVVGSADASTWLRFSLWCGLIAAYWYFWVVVCATVASISRTSSSAALNSISVWLLVVVILPSGLQFAFDSLIESQSRVQLLAMARSAEAEALGTVEERAEALMAQHSSEISDLRIEVPNYYRSAYIANAGINETVGQLLDQHDAETRNSHRLLDWVQTLSPATATFRSLKEITGAGSLRANEFENQVRGFFRHYFHSIGEATLQERRLTLAEAERIGTFRYEESLGASTIASTMAILFVFSIVFTLLSNKLATKQETS